MNIKNNNFSEFIENNLNPAQKKAVIQKDGILLVCAGAGSGKTRVITTRIINLMLNHDVQAHEVIALTFTNKAAQEMKERVASWLPENTSVPFLGTFHSYCFKLLKQYGSFIDLEDFSIIDSADQKKLMNQVLEKFSSQKKITPQKILAILSSLKNQAVSGTPNFLGAPDQEFAQIMQYYEKEKRAGHYLDFDDLLLKTLVLFKKNPEIKTVFQQRVRHVLVDEYQDTNLIQHELLKQWTCNPDFILDSLCVVGDEDQSIYSWRGATVANILHFTNDYPQAKKITIETNYRSVKPILDAANQVISNNTQRNPKNLTSKKQGTDRVHILGCMSGFQEGIAVAHCAQAYDQKKVDQCAVLYRAHYQSRVLEEVLIRYGVPYKIIGGITFYERLEIKDMLAYLRLINNPHDRISFLRVYNTPAKGLGKKFEERVVAAWDQNPEKNIHEIVAQLAEEQTLMPSKLRKLQEFCSLLLHAQEQKAPSKILAYILQRTKYLSYLEEKFEKEEAQTKQENVKELQAAISDLEQTQELTLSAFLDEVTLLQSHIKDSQNSDKACISLMTLHAAKGLEFDTIIIAGLEEKTLPSSKSIFEEDKLEEERRLLYVGITRARERLLLTHTRYRYMYGTMTVQEPSRFLKELPRTVTVNDACQWQAAHFAQYFQTWFGSKKISSTLTFPSAPAKTTSTNTRPYGQPNYKKPVEKKSQTIGKWRTYQTVRHQIFGTGIIQKIEKKGPDKIYLTIRFGPQVKKLDARFITT